MSEPELFEAPGASALIYRDAPAWGELKTAAIGGFSCRDAASGGSLIESAKARLRSEGFAAVVGPMDGDTWHRYRVVWESDGSAPFPMEPTSGPFDKQAFLSAGLAPISEYVSSRAALAEAIAGEPVVVPGVEISAWDGKDGERLVRRMFKMSLAAFASNRFYKPIGLDAFLKLYEPVMPLIDPRFVLFAHDSDGKLVGFLFGYPNRLEGKTPTTVVLKTYASALRGVGHALADRFHRAGLDLGFETVIHALMHVDNASRQRSSLHRATVFRRYALMGATL